MPDRYEILYLPAAAGDLEEAVAYLTVECPDHLEHILEEWEQKLERLALFPLSGSVPQDTVLMRMKYRFIVLDNYLAFYLVDEDSRRVKIHGIVHGKRNYQGLLLDTEGEKPAE